MRLYLVLFDIQVASFSFISHSLPFSVSPSFPFLFRSSSFAPRPKQRKNDDEARSRNTKPPAEGGAIKGRQKGGKRVIIKEG